MIKRNYCILQDQYCQSTSDFKIYETVPQERDPEQETVLTQGHFIQDVPIGTFQQTNGTSICCCSCQPIKRLRLVLYGQQLSIASRDPDSCCHFIKSNELSITTSNKILLGKIKFPFYCCLSNNYNILQIYNHENQLIYLIQGNCYQIGNCLPSYLRCYCGQKINYQIYDCSKKAIVGNIQNIYNSFSLQLLSFANKYEINLPKQASDKNKILLLNSIIYLNLKYQLI